jgi:hypothetical protein
VGGEGGGENSNFLAHFVWQTILGDDKLTIQPLSRQERQDTSIEQIFLPVN